MSGLNKLRFLTAGESHGPALSLIIEGLPSGLEINEERINSELSRRKEGYGRGLRMAIESDKISFIGGVRHGQTIGSPVSAQIENLDHKNWTLVMSPCDLSKAEKENPENKIKLEEKFISRVRPGHADLAGAIKYSQDDVRNILERSSARETAARVAVGAIAKSLLCDLGIKISSRVIRVGSVLDETRTFGQELCDRMKKEIDDAKLRGTTLGGIAEVIATGVPVGLGTHTHWDKRLDGLLAQALMSIQSVKAVEIGAGMKVAELDGSEVHDEIISQKNSNSSCNYTHLTNRAGGIEGGISNGEPIVCRVAFKPIPTLPKPLKSINLATKGEEKAFYERSDICIVPAGGVVAEAMMAIVLGDQILEKFGSDSMSELKRNFSSYEAYCLER